jgi:hypothetical protein
MEVLDSRRHRRFRVDMETTDVDEESMEDSGGCECGYDTGQELLK